MRAFVTNGVLWRVVGVAPGDPHLIDRTGKERLATADPKTATIHVSTAVRAPLLDRVMLHEVSHAVAMSSGFLAPLHERIPQGHWVDAEEWGAQLVERHGIESAILAAEVLGRPLCVGGYCID